MSRSQTSGTASADSARRPPRVVLQQTAIADYRREVLRRLWEHWGSDFEVLVGSHYFEPTTETEIDQGGDVKFVENRFLFGRRLLWQTGTVRSLVACPIAIVELNPRILSVWIAILTRRLLSRHTVAWGHAWPRKGRAARTEILRHVMRAVVDTLLVYTDSERTELEARMPQARVVTAPNAMYSSEEMSAAVTNNPRKIVCVGRLVEAKKPMLLLAAYARAMSRGLSTGYQLVFVGEGPERPRLEAMLDSRSRAGVDVVFLGHIPPSEIHALYEEALVSVSPGYVGLSITQSFSFGVPMIVARDEPHSPEIEAAVNGKNSLFVDSDDPEALATALLAVVARRDDWIAKRTAIMHDCAARYSVERMAAGFVRAAEP